MSATANVLVGLAISLLTLVSYLRWWRVAQREHYEPGRLVAMAAIWCRARPRTSWPWPRSWHSAWSA